MTENLRKAVEKSAEMEYRDYEMRLLSALLDDLSAITRCKKSAINPGGFRRTVSVDAILDLKMAYTTAQNECFKRSLDRRGTSPE